jgi:hypothetical protein
MTFKNYWDKPENRARASERMKAYWAKISPEARTRHINNTAPEVTSDYSAYVAQTAKIVGVSDDLEAVAACEKKVQQELGDHVSAARSQPYYLDITHCYQLPQPPGSSRGNRHSNKENGPKIGDHSG